MKNEEACGRVFDQTVPLRVYLWAAQTMRQVEVLVRAAPQPSTRDIWDFRFHLAVLAAGHAAGERIYHPSQLGNFGWDTA